MAMLVITRWYFLLTMSQLLHSKSVGQITAFAAPLVLYVRFCWWIPQFLLEKIIPSDSWPPHFLLKSAKICWFLPQFRCLNLVWKRGELPTFGWTPNWASPEMQQNFGPFGARGGDVNPEVFQGAWRSNAHHMTNLKMCVVKLTIIPSYITLYNIL